jgi:catechol 2,3-dioxygenase-like lactoylglutathione lyase family enzyme
MNLRCVFLILMMAAAVFGQLASPNAAGVSMGHIHLYVSDVAAQQNFWTTMMGGVPVANGKLEMIQFPGVMILLRKADTSGGPEGSIVNHLGFVWKDLPAALAKWKAAGLKIEQAGDPNRGFVDSPGDGLRVEFTGDPALKTPVAFHHIHLYPQDVPAMQAWYAKVLGGAPGKRAAGSKVDSKAGSIDSIDVPGVSLLFSMSETKLLPTAGRSLEHIGFEVKNLPEFLQRLEAMGIKPDVPIRPSNFSPKLRVAFISDPWGTKMEITEGLAP